MRELWVSDGSEGDRLGFQGQKQLPPFSDPLKSEGRQGLYSLSVDGRSERKEGILEDSMG